MMQNPPHLLPESLQPPSIRDRFRRQELGHGWVKYIVPHNNTTYLHHASLNLVTNADQLLNDSDRNKFGLEYGLRQLETLVLDEKVAEVDHGMEIFKTEGVDVNNDEMRGRYWAYLSNFPCHRELPPQAKEEALFILELMELQSLTNPYDLPAIPFSVQDIKNYNGYLRSSKDSSVPSAETIVVANVLANYYMHRSATADLQTMNYTSTSSGWPWSRNLSRVLLTFLCCGMPPNHLERFRKASIMYRRTLQKSQWQYFVEQVKRERAAANIMSGLLLASSVAFLAIPNLVDISQFFILLSVGFSLSAVVMGFNATVEDELLSLQNGLIENPNDGNERLNMLAKIMEEHYTVVLLSVLCFFVSVLVFSAYSIYSSVFLQKSFTIRYLFFIMPTCGLMAVALVTLRWNRLVNVSSKNFNTPV